MKTTEVKCNECGKLFHKRNGDYNRSKRMGLPHYCSRRCSIIHTHKNLTNEQKKNRYERIKGKGAIKKCNEYSPFREIMRRINNRTISRYTKSDINIQYLKDLWESQNGICPYTNIKMILPKSASDYRKIKSLRKASLDRIDSSKEYVKGNVQFICMAINFAKNNFPSEDIKQFVKEIKSN